MSTDPRTVDRDGFIVGQEPNAFGHRLTVGGLYSRVQRGSEVGVIVGLESTDDELVLYVVWAPNDRIIGGDTDLAVRAYDEGLLSAERVPAEGLIALDAWLPGVTS